MRVFNRLGIVPTLLILSDIGLAASPSGQAYSASEGSIRTPTTDSTAQVDVDGVRLFADNLGITVDEAIIRLDREPAISELQRSAQSLYGATYAGLWVDHSDAGIVNIASTRYDFDIVNRLSSEFPDPELLEFTIARYSLGQLELIQDDVMAVANQPSALGFPAVSSDLDYESNSVVLFPKRPLTDSQLGELSLLYGDAVTVDQGTHFETNSSCPGRFNCAPPLRGGIALKNDQSSEYDCTSAFTADNASDGHFLITAGHCDQAGGSDQGWMHAGTHFGTMTQSIFDGHSDFAKIQVTNDWVLNATYYEAVEVNTVQVAVDDL